MTYSSLLAKVYDSYFVANSWSSVPAVIDVSKIERKRSRSTKRSRAHNYYLTVIRYRYVFNDSEYTSSRQSFFQTTYSNSSEAQEIVNQYPVGSSITCLVDPNNPNQATMFRDLRYLSFDNFIGICFLVSALFLYYVVARIRPVLEKYNQTKYERAH